MSLLTRLKTWRSADWLPLVCAVICPIPVVGQSNNPLPPFVADTAMVSGFERFGSHAEIPERQAGSLLISELSCTACHASDDEWLEPKRGPRLNGVGNVVQQDWLRRYLADPHQVKSGTTMPHLLVLLPDAERAEAIEALVAFLNTQREPFPELKAGGVNPVVHEFWKRGDQERGTRLYHSIGCVACHEPDADYETVESKPSAIDELIEQLDQEEIVELGLAAAARRVKSVPHGDLTGKYSLRSLAMMLLDPARVRPNSRMPSLRLTPQEAADIATYLLARSGTPVSDVVPVTPTQALVDRGRDLFVELRCSNCHEVTGIKNYKPAKPLAELDFAVRSSCLEEPSADMARYRLDEMQRTAIRFVKNGEEPRDRSDADEVSFRMLQLNCFGCHERDGLGGVGRFRKPYFETVGNVDLGDEGRLPPSLGNVGRKLRPQALAAVFQPKSPPHRRYMTIRMPSYPTSVVELLISHLPVADGVDKSDELQVFTGSKLAEAGRDMVNTGCVQCHPFRGESLPGVVGIDLNEVTSRVYPRWFYDFIHNPNDLKNRTRMPSFFPNGRSNRPDLLDGNVALQISAIWAYLKNLEHEPLPEKIETARSANYELVPTDKPIVLRTFMNVAGTHAIAVGFPQGVHYAFDAEQVRMAIAWKGRFLDARGTWFERFTPPANPLGEHEVMFSPGHLFVSDDPREFQFGGYRLEANGVPTLLYRYGNCSIADHIEVADEGTLKRTLKIVASTFGEDVVLRAHAGRKLIASGPSTYTDEQGLSVTLPENMASTGSLQQSDDEQEWLIPLKVDGSTTVVLEYQW
ncbi:MAG: c-type cytochrome [Planctomycetaceae bacterium]|nr:c-type cytochrome [Planctomycetaceae bacterium]